MPISRSKSFSAGVAKVKWTKLSAVAALIVGAFVTTSAPRAYEQFTHVILSQQAFNTSILGQAPFEYGLGAFGFNNDFSISFVHYPDQTGLTSDLFKLVQLGSWYEDDGHRSLNHFFNPVNNQPLTTAADFIIGPHSTSPDWALEDKGQIDTQANSYADARQYYWTALIASDPDIRSQNFGMTYQSLGQVIHHIQDMAQPQHARDEGHCDLIFTCFFLGNLLVLNQYHPSAYEYYVMDCTSHTPDLKLHCPAVFDAASYLPAFDEAAAGASNTPFVLPRSFWTTGSGGAMGVGIAEYTNAGFIGTNTNFTGTLQSIQANSASLPSPNGNGATINNILVSDPQLFGDSILSPATATMGFVGTPVNDVLRPGSSAVNSMTSAISIFAQDLSQINVLPVFTTNKFTYAAAASFLLPRAIGYSAGLINYFFRGEIGISLPHEGVYGIVDHAAQYGPGMTTNPASLVNGFTTIKVNLTNLSPDKELMRNGTLAAIVRFRRNSHYTDTLTNEPGSPGINSLTAVRGSSDETAVATAVFDTFGDPVAPGTVNLIGNPQEFSFQFTNEKLPLNSTDVHLEIVWQGTVGSEQNTAVVASTIDLSEPSYLAFFNSLDYISIGGEFVTRDQLNARQDLLAQVQPTSCVQGTSPNLSLVASCFPSNAPIAVSLDATSAALSPSNLIFLQQLPVKNYIRTAILTDASQPTPTTTLLNSSPCNIGDPGITVNGLTNAFIIQSSDNTTTPVTVNVATSIGDIAPLRGINGWENIFCVYIGDGAPAPKGDPSVMTLLTSTDPSIPPNAIFPVQAQINFPQNLPE